MRGIKNCLCRAIVLLKWHHLSSWPVALKVENVANVCTAPAIDGLVVVTHHAEVAVPGGKLPYPGVLDAVGVLILVNVQVLPLRAVTVSNGGCLLQQAQPFEEQVVKVEGVKALQLGGIATGKSSDEALVMRDRAILHLLCGETVVLGTADGSKDQTWLRFACCGKVILLEKPLDHPRLVIGVIDGETLR